MNLQSFDLVLLLVFGLVGFMMRRFGLPILPLIIGVILGPRIERQLRTALAVAGGDVSTLWSEPLAVAIYVIIAVLLLWPAAHPSGAPPRPPPELQGRLMVIVVGYAPGAPGEAALRRAVQEARLRGRTPGRRQLLAR